jgi:hypothetical protein
MSHEILDILFPDDSRRARESSQIHAAEKKSEQIFPGPVEIGLQRKKSSGPPEPLPKKICVLNK